MKASRMMLVACILHFAVPSAYAQRYEDDTLFLADVTLRLGMSKETVVKLVTGRTGQYSLIESGTKEGWYFVFEKNDVTPYGSVAGSVLFNHNRLTFASKEWISDCKDVGDALHAILSRLRPNGEGVAWFSTDEGREPKLSFRKITLAVGKRRITVSSGRFKDHSPSISVEEAIGAKNIP